MSTSKQLQPAAQPLHVENDAVDIELTEDEFRRVVGYFDTLIEMDLAHTKRNEGTENVTDTIPTSEADENTAQTTQQVNAVGSNQARPRRQKS